MFATASHSGALLDFATHVCHGVSHCGAALQATLVCAEALLGEFQGALEGGGGTDLNELDDAALIRGKTGDLANNFLDQFVARARVSLAVGWLLRQRLASDDEAFVQAGGLWPHVAILCHFNVKDVEILRRQALT